MARSRYKITGSKINGFAQYPKTIVEAITWESEKKPLEEVLNKMQDDIEAGIPGPQGPQGPQGNTGSSVDYPYELVNNLTTDDATKGLSAAQGVVLDGKVSQLAQEVENIDRVLETSDRIVGKYRAITGGLANSAAYFYTNPIKLHKGDKVTVTDANIVTSVSIISEVDANNNFISVIYAGQGAVASYTFTVVRDMFIGLSALESQAGTISLETYGILQRLTDDEANIDGLLDTTKGLDTADVTTGAYWSIVGALATLGGYFYSKPIKFHKGDRIATDTAIPTITAVSYITQVDEENNFIAVLKAGTGQTEIIDFIVPEDGYISISAANSRRANFVIYQNGIDGRVDELADAVASISPAADTRLPSIDNNPLASIRRDAGYGAIIRKWGIIGDSLSSGEMQCYNEESTSASDYKFADMYQYSSGQVFARLIGADAYNFSNGGQTTWGWLKSQGVVRDATYIGGVGGGDWRHAQLSENLKDAYIIALGVNDSAKITGGDYELGTTAQITTYNGTDSDIDDTTTYPKSFVRYYAGIIQRLLSVQPKAKIFCVTPLGTDYAEISQAIRDIVTYFGGNVYLIDIRTYIPEGYDVAGYRLNGHLSPMGYTYWAYMYNTYIDWIIRNNGSAFRDTALIGTDYRPEYA